MITLVEGNIASGKTTLCKLLPGRAIEEHVAPALLRLFYGDPVRYGFALQVAQCLGRQHTLLAAAADRDGTQYILDRSIMGDFAFAAWNFACGNLTGDEWAAYLEYAGGTTIADVFARLLHKMPPDAKLCIVYLRDDAASCRQRALARSNTEASADTEYFAGLQLAHDLAWRALVPMQNARLHMVQLAWTDYSDLSISRHNALCNEIFVADTPPMLLPPFPLTPQQRTDGLSPEVSDKLCSIFGL